MAKIKFLPPPKRERKNVLVKKVNWYIKALIVVCALNVLQLIALLHFLYG